MNAGGTESNADATEVNAVGTESNAAATEVNAVDSNTVGTVKVHD